MPDSPRSLTKPPSSTPPPQLERGPSARHPPQRPLQTSHAASLSLVCRLTPASAPRPALSRLWWPLPHPTPLLQPAPASRTTPSLPTLGREHAENQKPPWDRRRAGRRLSLCQMQAQPPPGSLHMPDRQTPCLLACRGGLWPALPGGEQLTWAAGAGRRASPLPQGTSVTREGQPRLPASTRATPSRGDTLNVGDQGEHSQRPSSRHPKEGHPLQPWGRSPILPSLPSPLAVATDASSLAGEGGLAQLPQAGCSSWREVLERRLSIHAHDLSSHPCFKLQAVKGQGDIQGSWCELGAGSNVSPTSSHQICPTTLPRVYCQDPLSPRGQTLAVVTSYSQDAVI